MTVVGVCGDVIHDWFLRRNNADDVPADPAGAVRLLRCRRPRAGDRDGGGRRGPAGAAARRSQPAGVRDDDDAAALHERTIGLQYLAAIMAVFAVLALLLATSASTR